MNVIVYYPKTEQGMSELAQKVADVHNDAIRKYVEKIPCPKDQKLKLLNAVQVEVG